MAVRADVRACADVAVRAAVPPRRGAARGSRAHQPRRVQHAADQVQFPGQLRRLREVLVALQQDSGRRDPRAQFGEYLQDRFRDRVGVRVVPYAVPLDAARHMDVRDRLDRQLVQRPRRVLAPVDAVGVQVGDVDEQPYTGAPHQLRQELPLRQLLARPGEQGRDVLQRERHRQLVLGDPHVLAQHPQRVPGARHRQQVPGLQGPGRGQPSARPYERDVLGDQRRAQRLGARGQGREAVRVGALRPADAQRHAVRDHLRAALAQPQQGGGEVAGADVLRDHLHPVDAGQRLDRVGDLGPPADADAEPQSLVLAFHTVPLGACRAGVMAPSRGAEPTRGDVQRLI
ncbi:hypothetical protein GCM10018987_02660 [Streptomyces cremeus]